MKSFNPQRLTEARLSADMSRGDLAFAIRRISGGQLKATERGIRGWEKGENAPRGETVNVIAEATDRESSFFYTESSDEDEEAALPEVAELLEALSEAITPLIEKSRKMSAVKEARAAA